MKLFYLFVLAVGLWACDPFPKAEVILLNGDIYTVDAKQPQAEAIAISGGRIVAIGSNEQIKKYQDNATAVIDAESQFVMPGLIEGHGHFRSLGNSLMNLNFMNSHTWEEIVSLVEEAVRHSNEGEWITGRGWHQEKWDHAPDHDVFGYPTHHRLSEISPDNPVILGHASGHSVFANQKAMDMAGISVETPDPAGGRIVRDSDGNPIGVFEETAQYAIRAAYQEYLQGLSEEELAEQARKAIEFAQEECLANGITSFQDAGSGFESLEEYHQMALNGELDVRLWVMLRSNSENMRGKLQDYRIIDAGNHYYSCRAIKTDLDGALGSYGAWLLEPYTEKPDFTGQNTTQVAEVRAIAAMAFENEMQLCVHAIGDRANRETLNIFEDIIESASDDADLRWRIEHAQHIHPDDIHRFSELGVIASMQGIHCTSDAPYVEKRLGFERARDYSYPWRSLIDHGVLINNGTDTPVEDIDPFASLYASVTRKIANTGQEFFPEQAMTREEAIRSYTINNAYAAFEESDKGSLEVGKLADLVILDKNLLTCSNEEILEIQVLKTIVGGEIKYSK